MPRRSKADCREFIRAKCNYARASDHYIELLDWFENTGLGDDNFYVELSNPASGRFEERVWEMLLARRLAQHHQLHRTQKGNPDFGITHGGRKVWIEATVPAPKGLPASWLAPLEPGEIRGGAVPHDKILLRWTAAVKEKREKLCGREITNSRTGLVKHKPGYIELGKVGDTDAYVIAINGGRLNKSPDLNGISRLPYALEAVLPVGPLQIEVKGGGHLGAASHSLRYSLRNHNDAEVQTDGFLSPDSSRISAIVGCGRLHDLDGPAELVVVHNPLAECPLTPGLFGPAVREWVARHEGDDFIVTLS